MEDDFDDGMELSDDDMTGNVEIGEFEAVLELEPDEDAGEDDGADLFAVATLSEAAAVRELGPGWPILLLSPLLPEEDRYLADYDLAATVSTADEVARFDAVGRQAGKPIAVHLKIDTGMGRLGVLPSRALALARKIARSPWLELEGVATHFAGTSAARDPENEAQLERFLDHGANELLQLITTVLAVGGAMVWLSPGVAGVSFLPIPVILWGSLSFQKRLQPRYREVRERAGDLASQLANNLGGILTIKSYAAERWETERLRQVQGEDGRCQQDAGGVGQAVAPPGERKCEGWHRTGGSYRIVTCQWHRSSSSTMNPSCAGLYASGSRPKGTTSPKPAPLPKRWHGPVASTDRKSTRLNSSHVKRSRMPSSA